VLFKNRNIGVRIGALLVTIFLSIVTFIFNVVAVATDIDRTVVAFSYLGLDLLSPFVAYILAAALCISMLALHWRWKTKEHSRAQDLWYWVQSMLPEQVCDGCVLVWSFLF
jgi:hypothetical protein